MAGEVIIPIAIDHGFSMMKTVDDIFPTAISHIDEPFSDENVLQIGDQYYRASGKRIDVLEDKTSTDEFRLLTYVAIAKRLKAVGVKKAKVILAVGLPIGRIGREKQGFRKYLMSPKEITYKFSSITYTVTIENILVFPQCYGAIAHRISKMKSEEVVVDIGSWTIDTLRIIDHSPSESMSGSDPNGLIPCMRRIDEECMRLYNTKIGENIIRDVMINGKADIDDQYINVITDELTRYTVSVFKILREMGINTKTVPLTFIGGGAALMRRYGGITAKNIIYIDDIRANAKGYDMLLRAYLKKRNIKFK